MAVEDRRERILEATARCIARRGVRGLRVQDVAKDAGVSPGLLYYHFTDRAGLLAASLAFVNERADRYVAATAASDDPRERVRGLLHGELQERADVRENSAAWGELRASAIFDETLRDQLAAATRDWNDAIGDAIGTAQTAGLDPASAAALLTALVEGLSNRWLSGTIALAEAHRLLDAAIDRLLGAEAPSGSLPPDSR